MCLLSPTTFPNWHSSSGKRAFADHVLRHLAGDRHKRHRVHESVSDARHEIRRAGAGSRHAHARASGRPRVTFGGKHAALLVARQDRADFF